MTAHVARKRFGQNFLVDAGVIAAIVDAIAPAAGDLLVEIGPGLGALTRPLLRRLPRLHVIEIDRDIVARLGREFPPEILTIHQGDVLDFDFAALGTGLRVVGNLPYNISTPLLFHLAAFAAHVRDLHFMLQKEVVERIVAEPGTAAYGRLSVMLQYRFDVAWLLDVPAHCFDPAPRVESAVIRLQPKPPERLPDVAEADLRTVVSAAFAQRRKMLRNTLRGHLADADFAALAIAPTQRAEDLSLDDYVRITRRLAERSARASGAA